jgi:hypothetical protein
MKKAMLMAAAMLVAGIVASQALAAKPFAQATGGVTLANPTQYLAFNAFDYGATGDRGTVDYSNPSAAVSYQADVFCADVNSAGGWANFAYQIPPGVDSISGLYIVWHVTDGGSPGAGNDTAGFTATSDLATATAYCNDPAFTPANSYTITGGNLVVH